MFIKPQLSRSPARHAVYSLIMLVAASCVPTELPDIRLRSTQNRYGYQKELCAQAERCVIVFVAPWCPACHASIGFINGLRERLRSAPKVAFRVVAGGDTQEHINEMAQAIGGDVYLDYDRQFQRAARCSSVPRWLVLDRERKVLQASSGTPAGADDRSMQWFLEKQLKIGSFLD